MLHMPLHYSLKFKEGHMPLKHERSGPNNLTPVLHRQLTLGGCRLSQVSQFLVRLHQIRLFDPKHQTSKNNKET